MFKYLIAALALGAAIAGPAGAADRAPHKTMKAFTSDARLVATLKRLTGARQARSSLPQPQAGAMPAPPPSPSPSPMAEAKVAASSLQAESVTNVQTAGVDEGGIVKVHGSHLLMLRRGRLFSVDIDRLKPVAMINAYAPGADPSASWYDEMIVSGDTVAVVGYSYQHGGTEIGLFDIDAGGRLAYRATYHLRSDDYFSARNFASRQIGSKLIFYTPLSIDGRHQDAAAYFPAMRRWRRDAPPAQFRPIAPATRIYRSDDPLEPGAGLALHTVTVCDLAERELRCEATAVLGASGRVFYVSPDAVYVWTTTDSPFGKARAAASLFRMPLDGGAPSAIKVAGAPVDQFSFHESGDGHLNVLVRAAGRGEGMWLSELGGGSMALLRVALERFGDGSDSVPASHYRAVPKAPGYAVQNRYVGPWLLYAGEDGKAQSLHALRWDGRGEVQAIALPHRVERIEAMGSNAVVVGAAGRDLHFSTIALERRAQLAHRYVRADAAQGETRSHGFFYKPDGDGDGVLGLPVVNGGASVLYLRNTAGRLHELGELAASTAPPGDDGCVASCVDWYGNARPLFLKGRVFALMGYELVEGERAHGRLREVRRINFGPGPSR